MNKYLRRKTKINFQIQDLEEKLNLLREENFQEIKNKIAFQDKIRRYGHLKNIIEDINLNLDLSVVANSLCSIAFSVLAKTQGTCCLYLVDNQTQHPVLFKTKKEDKKLVIKAKEGDILDFWVLRHASGLFIEDVKKDFRFDLEQLRFEDVRSFSSLISSAFISERRILGILRLDHPAAEYFTQDDLRFLTAICDLGAVAIENALLFRKTQDLAIHDELTSLYTKGYFLERLKEEQRRGLRQRLIFSMLMLDIDHFKDYNDKFGHIAGDIVLKTLSQLMTDNLRELSPVISRFGGEEFLILLPRVDKKKAGAIAQDLRAKIENAGVTLRNQKTNFTVSIGVSNFPVDASEENELLLKADNALYKAKEAGRNRVALA